MKNCKFINNTAKGAGGAIRWNGDNGTITDCNFISNTARGDGGAVCWYGINGTLFDSNFISNRFISSSNNGGSAVYWYGTNGSLVGCNFTHNINDKRYGTVWWSGANGILSDCTFTSNFCGDLASGVYWSGANGILTSSTFINNTAKYVSTITISSSSNYKHNLICCTFINNTSSNSEATVYYSYIIGFMINCTFANSEWKKFNLISTDSPLTIDGGRGIINMKVKISNNNPSIHGISIVVLNNETYYYPPDLNINLIYLQNHEHETAKDNLQNNQ